MLLAKSAIDFKHVSGRVFGRDLSDGIGGCVFGDVDDGEVGADIDDIKRQQGVFHPETERAFLRENKEHTAERREFVAIHEAELTFFLGVCNLDCDVDRGSVLGMDDDLGRRGRSGRAGEKKSREEKVKSLPPRPIPLRERRGVLKRKNTQCLIA